MRKVKILIIAKDLLTRRVIGSVLQKVQHFQIVETHIYADGIEHTIQNLSPDVVLLDIEEVSSNPMEILTILRIRFPKLPLIILSPRTKSGAAKALASLRLGVFDFITKPERYESLLFAFDHFEKRVIPKVELAANLSSRGQFFEKLQNSDASSVQQKFTLDSESIRNTDDTNKSPVRIIVVGGCTGAPMALFSLLSALPSDLEVPVVIVQHFPQKYTSMLARELNRISPLEVMEAFEGAELKPGTAWIARGGYHAEIANEGSGYKLHVHRAPRELGNRPSINVLFRSAARHFGPGVMGIILSGAGTDGISGAGEIKLAGGEVVIQHPESALVPELPLNIMQSKISNRHYTLDEMSEQIICSASRTEIEVDQTTLEYHVV